MGHYTRPLLILAVACVLLVARPALRAAAEGARVSRTPLAPIEAIQKANDAAARQPRRTRSCRRRAQPRARRSRRLPRPRSPARARARECFARTQPATLAASRSAALTRSVLPAPRAAAPGHRRRTPAHACTASGRAIGCARAFLGRSHAPSRLSSRGPRATILAAPGSSMTPLWRGARSRRCSARTRYVSRGIVAPLQRATAQRGSRRRARAGRRARSSVEPDEHHDAVGRQDEQPSFDDEPVPGSSSGPRRPPPRSAGSIAIVASERERSRSGLRRPRFFISELVARARALISASADKHRTRLARSPGGQSRRAGLA